MSVSRGGYIIHAWLNGDGIGILVYLLRVLQDVFSKEPPLRSISQGQHGAAVAQQVPPPTPPTNNSARTGSFSRGSSRAPPPPPKPQEGQMNSPRTESGPSLPPLPPKQQNNPNNQFSGTPQGSPYGQQEPFRNGHIHGQQDLQAPSGAPPPPPKPYQSQQPPAPQGKPESARFSRYDQPAPLPAQAQSSGQPRQAQWPPSGAPPIQYTNHPPPQLQQYPPPQQHPSYNYNQPPPQPPVAQPPQPVPDLLSSSLEATLPSQHRTTANTSTPLPAPPIPPNPEKDALLSALSQVLHSHLHTTVAQTRAAAEPLRAQHAVLRQAHATLTAELRQLQELDGALAANERILAEGMREAERVTAEARQRAVPGVDEVLVAPTVVGSQLWGLCAEEVGIAEAMYALGRGLDAGRVGAETFVKQTRALARERFLKKALIKKIARGMGLDMDN
ncbi:MAG: hypothetical protein M1821_006508 [Bathelium mastoideum]|nr:MAG: hypothetical protein M1821_006508 [Bathelium mastoideum]